MVGVAMVALASGVNVLVRVAVAVNPAFVGCNVGLGDVKVGVGTGVRVKVAVGRPIVAVGNTRLCVPSGVPISSRGVGDRIFPHSLQEEIGI